MHASPWPNLVTEEATGVNVYILGVPFDGAVSNGKGASLAPDRIRYLSRILPAVTETGNRLEGLQVRDEGDVPVDLNWEKSFSLVRSTAEKLMQEGKFTLFLGGDHSVSIPLVEAFSKVHSGEKIGVVHFDAHCDLCDVYEGHRWSHACILRRTLELSNISDQNLAMVGIRAFEPQELNFLQSHPEIRVITARDIFLRSLPSVLEELINRFQEFEHIYLSIDIDILDPAFAPGTGTPEAGGLSTRELMELVNGLISGLPVSAMDIVEVSPPMDSSDITSWAALKVIYEVFGQIKLR